MPPLRRRIAAAAALATILPLTACAGEEPVAVGVPVGDIVEGRTPDQVAEGDPSFLMLPVGRLDLRVGEPVQRLERDETRERVEQQAPEGGRLVPVAWRLDADVVAAYRPLFGEKQPLTVELVADGTSYTLAPPYDGRSDSIDFFYVAVEGEAEELELAVTYDGVTQTVDLRTGERDEGVAEGLYRLDKAADRPSAETSACPTNGWIDDPTIIVNLSCSIGEPVTVPYVAGEWAEEGSTFVTMLLSTTLLGYQKVNLEGGSAIYTIDSTKDLTRLGGERATRTLGPYSEAGVSSGALVFDVSGKVPDKLSVLREYKLTLSGQSGDIDPAPVLTTKIGGEVPLR